MENVQGFDFFRLHFNADGRLEQRAELDALKQRAAAATDAIFIAHGFRNDEGDAGRLYTRFLETLRAHINGAFQAKLGARRFVVAGVFWPSKAWSEDNPFEGSTAAVGGEAAEKEQAREKLKDLRDTAALPDQKAKIDKALALLDKVEDSRDAQDDFVANVLSILNGANLDANEGIDKIRQKDGSDLLDKLKVPLRNPVAPREADVGGVAAVGGDIVFPGEDGGTQGIGSAIGSIFGRIGQFLNLTTWYVMKERSGTVGANGVAAAVRELKASAPNLRVHLVGHSLGGRLMASCANALAGDPQARPDSVSLLEAAFSHFGFSPGGHGRARGFFRDVVEKNVVKGPFLATFSAQDSVVGTVYAIASRLAGDNLKAIGDANDPFGGIGRNGAIATPEATSQALNAALAFTPGKLICLDGSGGLIKDHGDVTNSQVTLAVASAIAAT